MGVYIVQNKWTITYWSHKNKDVQLKYTYGDEEFHSIIMILTEFCTVLLGI